MLRQRIDMSSQTIKISRNAGRIARERRVQLGLTQREVAQRSGVSERTVYSFELGEKPGIHLSKMLAIDFSLFTLIVYPKAPSTSRNLRQPESSKSRNCL